MGIQRRAFARADLAAAVGILIACRKAEKVDRWPTVSELRLLCEADGAGWRRQVWTRRRGDLVSFAVLNVNWGSLYIFTDPQADLSSTVEQMVDWALDLWRDEGPAAGGVRCCIRDDDVTTLGLLADLGFSRHEQYAIRLARSLTEPIPAPELPVGFSIRSVTGEDEAEAYVNMHRDAFGTTGMTVEDRLAEMRDVAYQPDLDLVAVGPHGQLVSFCVGCIDEEENTWMGWREGWTDPIGTRPAFRRRGLARATLTEALRRLNRRGMDTAILGTGSWNTATQQLCASCGFQKLFDVLWYTRAAPS